MIEIQLTEAIVFGGGVVSGYVILTPDQTQTAKTLQIDVFWGVYEDKSPVPQRQNSRQSVTVEIAGAQLTSGRTYQFPFEFSIPNGPASYAGQSFDVRWVVQARVKRGKLFDNEKERAQFILLPDSNFVPYSAGRSRPRIRNYWTRLNGIERLGKIAFGAVLVFGGILCMLALSDEPLTFVVALPFVLIGSGIMAWQVRHWIARLFFAQLSVDVDKTIVSPAGAVTVSVNVSPWLSRIVDDVTVNLAAFERYERARLMGTGSDRTQSRHIERTVIYEERATLIRNRQLAGFERHEAKASFTLPQDAPLTFITDTNQILWQLTVILKTGRLPRWVKEIVLDVEP